MVEQVNSPVESAADYVTLEVAKERDRQFYNACVIPEKQQLQVRAGSQFHNTDKTHEKKNSGRTTRTRYHPPPPLDLSGSYFFRPFFHLAKKSVFA